MLASGKDVFTPKRAEKTSLLQKDMKNSELKEYLNTFSDDANVVLLLANPMKRKLYEVERVDFITDMEQPVFCVTVGEAKDMDEDMVTACEEDERDAENLAGQMEITDFPEVMP